MADLTWKMERFTISNGSDPIEYHTFVWPSDDMMEHDPYEYSCPCMPKYKTHIGVHAVDGESLCLCTWFELTHHSLDGRELSEPS